MTARNIDHRMIRKGKMRAGGHALARAEGRPNGRFGANQAEDTATASEYAQIRQARVIAKIDQGLELVKAFPTLRGMAVLSGISTTTLAKEPYRAIIRVAQLAYAAEHPEEEIKDGDILSETVRTGAPGAQSAKPCKECGTRMMESSSALKAENRRLTEKIRKQALIIEAFDSDPAPQRPRRQSP